MTKSRKMKQFIANRKINKAKAYKRSLNRWNQSRAAKCKASMIMAVTAANQSE